MENIYSNENLQKNNNKEEKSEQNITNNNSNIDINSINNNTINENKIIINDNDNKNEKKGLKENDNYYLEIKKYLDVKEQNKEYMDIINNNPKKLFEIINDGTIMFWQSVVFNYEATIIDSDADILTVTPERKDQNVIINDSKRTRVRESSLVPGFMKILEEILTFYCNTKKIDYKQGLNEIFGPLILIKYKMKNFKLINVFNFGEAFIDKFLPNYFYENNVYSLKSSISLFVLLFKYHEPSVYNYLDSLAIPHELYAANWLLTLRAQKLNLDILYVLWDNLMKINDPLFIDYILVAIIKCKRELLIHCDSNLLLKVMVALTIISKEELDKIIKIALELRNLTPYSFRLLSNDIGFLKTNNKNILRTFNRYKPESIPTIQIYPVEILHVNYPSKIICPDNQCTNNLKNMKMKIDWGNNKFYNCNKNNHICEKCNMNIEKNLNFIIIDLRLFPPNYFKDDDDYFKMGFISGMMAIEKEELKSDDIDKLLTSRLLSTRGKNHIVLMTSRTDYFHDFDQKFYSDDTSDLIKKKMLFGVIETQKSEKKLNLEDAERNLDLKEIYRLKEYDNLRKLMISMKNNNFPYVSYLEGGFEALHQESINYNIELVDHDKKKCKLCQKKIKETKEEKQYKKLNSEEKILNISDTLWKNKKVISEKELNSFFCNENNVVLICNLRKYKNKYYHKNDIDLFVAILFDKKIIEIYQNDTKKQKNDNKDNSNYYNLGIKEDKKKTNLILRLFDVVEFENIEKVKCNHEYKNIIILKVRNKEFDKNKMIIDESFEIEFEFHSIEDSKTFISSLKKLKKYENFNLFSSSKIK